MSSIAVAGDTSGVVTISAPAVAGTPTLTLPTTSGTIITTASSTGISGSAISSGTVAVAYGGTGTNSATAYAVQCGGTTSTGAHQSIASVGTSGQVLTSNGPGALPTFQAAPGGFSAQTVYSTAGSFTFTIPSGKTTLKVYVTGGGGGGGGTDTNTGRVGSGGGAGGTAIKYLTGLTPGNTLTVTVGSGGATATGDSASGGTGTASSLASGTQTISTITGNAGAGGGGGASGANSSAAGGTSSGGDLNITGQNGIAGTYQTGVGAIVGTGGASYWGGNYGGGGRGAATTAGASIAGSVGVVVIEY